MRAAALFGRRSRRCRFHKEKGVNISAGRINFLARRYGFARYLEIGVDRGETFLGVAMPHKTAVDPVFAFNVTPHRGPTTQFFPQPSDDFFAALPRLITRPPYASASGERFCFDIVFIDGLHTFAQAYRDFLHSLPYTHEKTIWIFDDTVPCDPWSAIPDQEKSCAYRKMAGLEGAPWHGDVYKAIFALHDFHPEFSYATQVTYGNPQTIVWRTEKPAERRRIFGDLAKIAALSYFDMLDCHRLLLPVDHVTALDCVGTVCDPLEADVLPRDRLVKPLTAAQNGLANLSDGASASASPAEEQA